MKARSLLDGMLPIIAGLEGHYQTLGLRESLMVSLVSQVLDGDETPVVPGAMQCSAIYEK